MPKTRNTSSVTDSDVCDTDVMLLKFLELNLSVICFECHVFPISGQLNLIYVDWYILLFIIHHNETILYVLLSLNRLSVKCIGKYKV